MTTEQARNLKPGQLVRTTDWVRNIALLGVVISNQDCPYNLKQIEISWMCDGSAPCRKYPVNSPTLKMVDIMDDEQ